MYAAGKTYPPYHIPHSLTLSTQMLWLQEAIPEDCDTGAAIEEDENHVTENVCSADEEDGQPGSVKVGVGPPAQ